MSEEEEPSGILEWVLGPRGDQTLHEWVFGRKKNQREVLVELNYRIDMFTKQLAREQIKLASSESIEQKNLEKAIENSEDPSSFAKFVVVYKHQWAKYENIRTKLGFLKIKCGEAKFTHQYAENICNLSNAFGSLNEKLNADVIDKALTNFEAAIGGIDKTSNGMNTSISDYMKNEEQSLTSSESSAEEQKLIETTKKKLGHVDLNLNIPTSTPVKRTVAPTKELVGAKTVVDTPKTILKNSPEQPSILGNLYDRLESLKGFDSRKNK